MRYAPSALLLLFILIACGGEEAGAPSGTGDAGDSVYGFLKDGRWITTDGVGTPEAEDLGFSNHPSLCLPCIAPTDCSSVGGLQDHCVAFGGEGSFCGGDCADGCPAGTTCLPVTTVDGLMVDQCVPETGLCACSTHAVEAGLWTLCEVTNGWGSCPGKRSCVEAGLTACEGLVPSKETCDGDDDDCDGMVDEGTCDDHEHCTEDSCMGSAGCQHLPQDGGECGGICIAGGTCVAGECVGQLVMNCDDGNPCTEDFCDPEDGCGSAPHEDACDDGDPCTTGDLCQGGVCAGTPQVPCDPDPCVDGECGPGAQEDEVESCGNCGSRARLRTCTDGCTWAPWGDWEICAGEGPCAPGDTGEEEAPCGSCGSKTRTRSCNDICQWDEWGSWSPCAGEGACSPGQTQSEQTGCGSCGSKTRTRTCSDACQWGGWGSWGSCSGEGSCSPGQTQNGGCDACMEKKCSDSCQWSGCQLKPGATCEWKNGTHWKCCASGKWHFCLPPVYGCVWSSDCITCSGCGC